MSRRQKPVNTLQKIFQHLLRISRTLTKGLMNWLLRSLMLLGRRRQPHLARAGFVLPTVIMVMLVVALITTAIVIRSFDRAKNISNYRVNQEVLNSALPALDRARAKVEALFADPNLPRGTPSEISLNDVLTRSKYTLGDETQLKLAYDFGNGQGTFNPDGTIQSRGDTANPANSIENEEVITTAWRFPVDTDNNGLYDSFTLYGLFFRSPNTNATGFLRKRVPLDSRALPMDDGNVSGSCAAAAGTSASLVGSNGWYKSGGQLKKSLFTYVTTAPITNKDAANLGIPAADASKYENYKGNKGFSALEYQRDQAKVPLANNAVLYEDDVDIVSGTPFTLNGRIFTNSNLFLTRTTNGTITLKQVSRKESCFYEAENAKIVVGGNVGYGFITGATNSDTVGLELFRGKSTNPATATIAATNTSVTNTSNEIAYNTKAYEDRIKKLVDLAVARGTITVSTGTPKTVTSVDPSQVKRSLEDRLNGTNPPNDIDEARREELDRYFRKRTRRVPFKEVAYNATDAELTSVSLPPVTDNDALRPPDDWMFPFDPTDGKTHGGYGELTLRAAGDKLLPPATEFESQEEQGNETFIGDRAQLGNNLPALWFKDGEWVGQDTEQAITGTKWDAPNEGPRTRKTRVETLSELGGVGRDGFWESKAAEQPVNVLDGVGGLRIVTGAGVYLPKLDIGETLAVNASKVVWPDYMPVVDPPAATYPLMLREKRDPAGMKRPHLQMRATAVYHYKYLDGKKPIACVANYYDPTNATTAAVTDYNGRTYPAPTLTSANATIKEYLDYEAKLVYPNGRQVNPQLKDAMDAVTASQTPTLAQQAAIDSTICGLQILGKKTGDTTTWGDIGAATETPTSGYNLPNDTIKEIAFLDARQVKSIESSYDPAIGTGVSTLTGNYDLPIEERQPLEVRATVVDISKLKASEANGTIAPQEYLLPNSGIVYATRDDALPDASDPANPKVSPTDFKLDPTRRPNGIMLINGQELWREAGFREVEKGLILASNLPVYIKGEFNPHKNGAGAVAEFDGASANTNFACRTGDPRLPATSCTDADTWRPATIISDAVTLLSSAFKEGYRADGDYDLRNNQIDNIENPFGATPDNELSPEETAAGIKQRRRENGFLNNNFLTSSTFRTSDTAYLSLPAGGASSALSSSYFNNFVTPIQRRVKFPEYVMEICKKSVVSECTGTDWYVNPDAPTKKATASLGETYAIGTHKAGTTVDPADSILGDANPELTPYPRRVAFARDASDNLILSGGKPIILGINSAGKIACYAYSGTASVGGTTCNAYTNSNKPRERDNALWYRGINASGAVSYGTDQPPEYINGTLTGTTNEQPILVPVLQLHVPTAATAVSNPLGNSPVRNTQWLPRAASDTIFNLVMATGDNPSRPPTAGTDEGDFNGGLPNLPRFLENWVKEAPNTRFDSKISGSFIQIKRSAYASAPQTQLPKGFPSNSFPTNLPLGGPFNYPQGYNTGNNAGKTPSYEAPTRTWGFDVGLLSQLPDLFAQQFTLPPTGKPNEFFREVSRDDEWVKTLLCAKTLNGGNNAINSDQRPTTFCTAHTGS